LSAGSLESGLATSRLVLTAILAVLAMLALVSAVLFQAPEMLGRKKVLTDFDSFYIAGTMADHGQAAAAYDSAKMLTAQQEVTGTRSFMPWTYPPPYTLLMAGFALLPIGFAYLLFIVGSLIFYLVVMRRIAGEYLPGVLIAILPVIVLIVRTGQNGFLVGGLVGCFLLAFLRRSQSAGVPLGLMILKPHLAAGIALLALLGRRWTAMAIAAGIVVAALAAATLAFGSGIWPAFLGGVHDASQFLAKGYYPLFRMSSVYAAVRALGGPPAAALAAHCVVALAALGFLFHVWRRGYEPRVLAAVACAVALLVSPYSYDYDLAILGVGIAFVLPRIIEHSSPSELRLLLFLSWITTGYGLAVNTMGEGFTTATAVTSLDLDADTPLSATAFGLLPLLAVGFAILRRSGVAGEIGGSEQFETVPSGRAERS
jgi:hypothetical protein